MKNRANCCRMNHLQIQWWYQSFTRPGGTFSSSSPYPLCGRRVRGTLLGPSLPPPSTCSSGTMPPSPCSQTGEPSAWQPRVSSQTGSWTLKVTSISSKVYLFYFWNIFIQLHVKITKQCTDNVMKLYSAQQYVNVCLATDA